jgi:hypothetical protein
MGDVLNDLKRVPGNAWDTVRTQAKGAATQFVR